MDVKELLDMFLHIDKSLGGVISRYGTGTYLILFLIVFAETGLVITPFLPGDSLLFAAGAFAAIGRLELAILLAIFGCAALLGDNVNYFFGKYIGPAIFQKEQSKFFKKSHLDKTHQFFEKHGPKAIILARFVPIVRTFSPFVAGIGRMAYSKFLTFSILGAVLWVTICVNAGYFFGQHPFVKKNFSIVVIAIVMISLLPVAIEILKHRSQQKALQQQ